jgi:hypothetical protein
LAAVNVVEDFLKAHSTGSSGTRAGLLTGAAGIMLMAALALAQAPSTQGGEQNTPAAGGQAPAQPAQDGGRGGGGRGGRGGRGGGGGGAQSGTFFITSVGKGDGGNLGGLAGADAHCAQLAKAAGLPAQAGRTWRAYLSAGPAGGRPAVNARDRIGAGPWNNVKGVLVASNVADLHGDIERDRNQINKATALTETGATIGGVGDASNQHDILTGSDTHGRAVAGTTDTTCSNWTSNASGPAAASGSGGERGGAGGRGGAAAASTSGPGANVGHHDRQGGNNTSWNFAHRTRGCSQKDLADTGGAGLFYCFAAN